MWSDWRRTGISQERPSQPRSSWMPCSYCGRQRLRSMSSRRSRKRPFASRAARSAVSAENAWPRCSQPVGEGAKRVTNTPPDLGPADVREQAHMGEDGAQEGELAAQSFLEGLELAETRHLREAM